MSLMENRKKYLLIKVTEIDRRLAMHATGSGYLTDIVTQMYVVEDNIQIFRSQLEYEQYIYIPAK